MTATNLVSLLIGAFIGWVIGITVGYSCDRIDKHYLKKIEQIMERNFYKER